MSWCSAAYRSSRRYFSKYNRYVAILKWLTLALFAYVITLAAVKVPWGEALRGLLLPSLQWDGTFLTTLVAILGTTISPYLFIWQSSQEAEEQRIDPEKEPLKVNPSTKDEEFSRIRIDTMVGMAFSNIIAIAIIITTAATLHANGKTTIETSAQAAEALRPLAGVFAELIFALGLIGTGLLAIPVLAGSTAYAIGECRKWRVGLSRKPNRAVEFYAVLAISVAVGIGLNFTPLDPIKALYWSAVINGVLAPPVMVLMMILVRKKKVMGELQVRDGFMGWGGWPRQRWPFPSSAWHSASCPRITNKRRWRGHVFIAMAHKPDLQGSISRIYSVNRFVVPSYWRFSSP